MPLFPFGWRAVTGAGVLGAISVLMISETLLRPDHEIIRGFQPNTVVELKLTCALCPPEEIQALRNAPLRVSARGAVVNTEPRWTLFGRAVRNLERVVGLVL